jgi:hypothetical protein
MENGRRQPLNLMPLSCEPFCQSFHYGQAILKVMKAYKDSMMMFGF